MISDSKVERAARKQANARLAKLPIYHDTIPNGDVDTILTECGFNTLAEGIYCGRDGRINEQVGPKTWISLTWHKMDVSGRYEIVCYLS